MAASRQGLSGGAAGARGVCGLPESWDLKRRKDLNKINKRKKERKRKAGSSSKTRRLPAAARLLLHVLSQLAAAGESGIWVELRGNDFLFGLKRRA